MYPCFIAVINYGNEFGEFVPRLLGSLYQTCVSRCNHYTSRLGHFTTTNIPDIYFIEHNLHLLYPL